MTFDQYIQNPMGIANSVISNREMYRNMYTIKLDTIMVREMGHIEYHTYKSGDKFYCYIKVPSEVVEKFYYDVVIEFTPTKGAKPSKTLKDYDVRFYSNDPAFVFTFAHAFIKNDMFIKAYADKMSKEAVRHTGKIKNPMDTVGYVKSLFFAYLIMRRFDLFNKILYVDKYNEKFMKNNVMHADRKIALRTELGQEYSTKKKREEKAAQRKQREEADRTNKIPQKMQTNRSSSSNKIKTTSMIGTRPNRQVKKTTRIGGKK